jgi:hypothetical protein
MAGERGPLIAHAINAAAYITIVAMLLVFFAVAT